MLIISKCRFGVKIFFFPQKSKEETQATCYEFANKITKALLSLKKHLGSFKKALVLLVLTWDNLNRKSLEPSAWHSPFKLFTAKTQTPKSLPGTFASLSALLSVGTFLWFGTFLFGLSLAVPKSGGLRLLAKSGLRSQTPLECQPASSQLGHFERGS